LKERAGCQWLTAVILATWEAKFRRLMTPDQSRKVVLRSHPNKELSTVAYTDYPSYEGG
jgi:hypothetical protein